MQRSWFLPLLGLLLVRLWAADSPTAAVLVDQAGYQPNSPKLALVLATGNAKVSFSLCAATTGAAVFHGELKPAVYDAATGRVIRTADFTGFKGNGRFYLQVDGVGRSWTFAIAPDVFQHVYFLSMRAFYGQRCGTAVDLAPDFPEYKHPACHLAGAYDKSSGKAGPHASAKGWHDAGDYGRYTVNGGISTGTLLWTWELFHNHIEKVGLHIPESGGSTPDLLSEVRWNLDWMLSMQDEDGGVFHKQTSSRFSGFVMPQDDKLPSLVVGTGNAPFKSSCATADLAAVSAIAARVFKPYDSAYATQAQQAAEKAWAWLDKNPNVTFQNPPGISTGAYGDDHCEDEHLWAAAELARTTHKPAYSAYFQQHYRDFLPDLSASEAPTWSRVADFGLWTYALSGVKDEASDSIRKQSVSVAKEIAQRTQASPYKNSLLRSDYIWGSNAVAMNYAVMMLVANQFSPDRSLTEASADDLHYVLGRNAFSLSWITQVGDHAVQHPHHRPSGADNLDEPWPGLMSGGPNAGRQDRSMQQFVPADGPPALAYIDQMGAYACNEVAINWNAPLVFVLAALTP